MDHHENVGRRRGKEYFTVKGPRGEMYVMSMARCDRFQVQRDLFEQIMTGLRSHFVLATLDADYVEEKNLVVIFRRMQPKGSLRDLIYRAKPMHPFSHKYEKRTGTPMSEERIACWGRHILEGMNFVRLKGFPAGHVHCGNVIVENGIAKISDYELKLLPALRQGSVELALMAARPQMDPDVISFAAIVWEMSLGAPLDVVDLQQPLPRNLSPNVGAVLGPILYGNAAPVTLEALLNHAWFANAPMPDLAPLARVRLGPRAKEALRECRRLMGDGDARPKKQNHVYADTQLTTTSAGATASAPPASAAVASGRSRKSKSPRVNDSNANNANKSKPKPEASKAAPSAPVAPVAAPKAPPPAPAAPRAPAGPPPPKAKKAPAGRGGLLSSIEGFGKRGLKKTVTVVKGADVGGKVV